jgi:hypothetical protein
MYRSFSILFWMMICPIVASAQQEEILLRLMNDSLLTISPGVTFNVAVKVVNNSDNDEMVSIKIRMPNGWRCFSPLNSIRVSGSGHIIKILTLKAPSNAISGNYDILIEAANSKGTKLCEIKVPVFIESKLELAVALIEGTEYVFSGDSVLVKFSLQNRSNCLTEIKTRLKGTGIDEERMFSLAPDSEIVITKKILTEKGIVESSRKNLSLSATINNYPKTYTSCSFPFTIIPSSGSRSDTWDKIPVLVSTFFVSDNPGGKRMYALMSDISGEGFLDNRQTKNISFHIQGPDRQGKPLYGVYDEYFIKYRSPHLKLLLGDHIYALSCLTEYSRYARGGAAEYSFKNFRFGSFINYPRFYPKIKQETALYAGYSIPDKFSLNLGCLYKLLNTGETNNIITINGILSPVKWINADWEYASGSNGNTTGHAVKTNLNINFKAVNLTYLYTLADKDFPGYFTDTRHMMLNGNISITRGISLGANYSDSHQNVARDTLYGSSPYSKNMLLSVNYSMLKNWGLSLSYNSREQQDRMTPMKFNFNERSVRLNINRSTGNLGFNLAGEYGKNVNLLMAENEQKNSLYKGQFTTTGRLTDKLSINCFINYQHSKSYNIREYKNWIYGISASGSAGKRFGFSLQYQSSYNTESYLSDRNLLNGKIIYNPGKNNAIEGSCRYSLAKNSLNAKELAFELKLIHTFNVPVSKKKDVGKLSGKISDNDGKIIPGIVVSAGTYQAVSDKRGCYNFPVLPTGHYFLMINYQAAGLYAIPGIPGPYEIDILPGKETKLDIALTVAARITGETSIVKEVSDDDKNFAGVRNQLGRLLIEATNGKEVYRIFSGEDGEFAFESLRPGEWTVKVYENGIPEDYELVNPSFTFLLEPGKTQNVEVKIREIRRKIKFQKAIIQKNTK